MGKQSNAMIDYFSDNERFASLVNGSCFGGSRIVRAEDLTEGSETYIEEVPLEGDYAGKTLKAGSNTTARYRDIKKYLRTGGAVRVLAVEAQNLTDFTMPLRHMNYDVQEYKKQLNNIKQSNKKEGNFSTAAERMCGMKKTDRLDPTYTICLYHGEEKWEGPRSLKDMMDFGESGGIWKELFSDYNMHLVCINEIEDFSVYGSPLKELFSLLSVRNDKEALQKLIEENVEVYENMDEETANVANTIVGGEVVMAKKEQKYDPEEMCTGLRGIIEDSKMVGKNEGESEERARGLQALIESCQAVGGTIEATITQVIANYHLSKENARACVKSYWK